MAEGESQLKKEAARSHRIMQGVWRREKIAVAIIGSLVAALIPVIAWLTRSLWITAGVAVAYVLVSVLYQLALLYLLGVLQESIRSHYAPILKWLEATGSQPSDGSDAATPDEGEGRETE
jgi:hypothetical protein